MSPANRSNLYDLTRAELTARLAAWGFSPVHAARLWNYLYWECVGSWDAMPELPAKVRTRLTAECALAGLPVAHELHSRDGFTRKFLLGLADGRRIETVLMRFTGRATACVSSQVGCAMGCGFCATGQMGFQRHLTRRRNAKPKTQNSKPKTAQLVLMGMGEPLHNYDAVMHAVDILRDSNGLALGASASRSARSAWCRASSGSPTRRGRCTSPSRCTRHAGGARRARARGEEMAARRADGGLPLLQRATGSGGFSTSGR
jgi:adenine C2-methylase RlmN of 23S rRNA A2503 and tRNA A37